ncbi:hypothetical protein P7C70_g7167, partial [Phenoliferia sp. Uapishka_3]
MSDATPTAPSQVSGAIKTAQGVLYSGVGGISSDPSWHEEGEALKQEGAEETEAAKKAARDEATGERLEGKAQSAWGMVTGNQETMKEGNLKAEKAEWKKAAAEGTVPTMSAERAKGKVESAIGMVTGDKDKQASGNIRAEKAEWTQG